MEHKVDERLVAKITKEGEKTFPLVFASGVDIEAFVRLTLRKSNHLALLEGCKRVRSWLNEENRENLSRAKCEQILFDVIQEIGK